MNLSTTFGRADRNSRLLNVTLVSVVAFCVCAVGSEAQEPNSKPGPQVSFGMSVPLDFNSHETCCSYERSIDTTVGGWGEMVAFASPLVAFHTGIDFPKPYSAHIEHASSAGFVATLRHRDTVVYELIGFHSHSSSRVQPLGLVGFGVVFNHTTTDYQEELCCTGPPLGPVKVLSGTQIDPSFLGGLDVSVRVSPKVAMLFRMQGRITLRRDAYAYAIDNNTFGWFSLVPSVGLQIHSGH
jgi:hypothetical protein